MNDYETIVEFFTNQTEKWGEFSIHDTEPATFTATLTKDKEKLHAIYRLEKRWAEYDDVYPNILEKIMEVINDG